jgi:hypothetical protein
MNLSHRRPARFQQPSAHENEPLDALFNTEIDECLHWGKHIRDGRRNEVDTVNAAVQFEREFVCGRIEPVKADSLEGCPDFAASTGENDRLICLQ